MRIQVDRDRRGAHGICESLAPDFRLDDDEVMHEERLIEERGAVGTALSADRAPDLTGLRAAQARP